MKQFILIAVTLMLVGGSVMGAEFQKGLDAYNKGELAAAQRLLKPLANDGDANAQLYLGKIYHRGHYRKYEALVRQDHEAAQDHKIAVKWYTLSAAQGNAEAIFRLAIMYRSGLGVLQDRARGLGLFKKAAGKSYVDAQFVLGEMYEQGLGVLQNFIYTHMWWNIAGLNGSTMARALRDEVGEKMTPVQIAEAQELARECVKKKYKGC
jgi:uncharacterized protein